MTPDELTTLAKQALGNKNVTSDSAAWYLARVNSAYRRICTFQGPVKRPGMRQPQLRVLRFFELADSITNTITSALTDNFVTPATSQASLFMVTDVYDTTNDRWMSRPGLRHMRRLNPDATGIPREWVPDGKGGVLGYRIYPRPSTSAEEITVREYVYKYPAALTSGGAAPVIPEPWHQAIWIAAAAEGARLLEWPEKAAEFESQFMEFLAERKSPMEEASSSGGRRWFTVGPRAV